MRQRVCIVVVLLAVAGLVYGVVIKNEDSPKLGNWDFKLQQEWDLEAVGDEVLVDVRGMQVDREGNLYLGEFRQRRRGALLWIQRKLRDPQDRIGRHAHPFFFNIRP